MKIHFDGVDFHSASGPNTFANRLARRFFEMGHEVSLNGPESDVSLVFIEKTGSLLAKKIVQRLDGIWFKPNEFNIKNKKIESLYRSADAVVWQSNFDKGMSTKWFGEPKLGVVIRNGICVETINEITIPPLIQMTQDYERIYVCSANWHPQKRLKSNIDLFQHLQKKRPKSCLIVLGNNPDVLVASPHIFYTGPVDQQTYLQIYSVASWMIHLAWADHCPNVVVEALSQGTPVICSEVGGTKELIGNYGHVLNEQPYEYTLEDYDNPPTVDVTQISDLPDRSTLDYSSIPKIDIDNCAKSYIELFETICR